MQQSAAHVQVVAIGAMQNCERHNIHRQSCGGYPQHEFGMNRFRIGKAPDGLGGQRGGCRHRTGRRRGVPDDLVGTVLFLLSDASAFITGQTINVDGGRHVAL